jgi:hypothetical protein
MLTRLVPGERDCLELLLISAEPMTTSHLLNAIGRQIGDGAPRLLVTDPSPSLAGDHRQPRHRDQEDAYRLAVSPETKTKTPDLVLGFLGDPSRHLVDSDRVVRYGHRP